MEFLLHISTEKAAERVGKSSTDRFLQDHISSAWQLKISLSFYSPQAVIYCSQLKHDSCLWKTSLSQTHLYQHIVENYLTSRIYRQAPPVLFCVFTVLLSWGEVLPLPWTKCVSITPFIQLLSQGILCQSLLFPLSFFSQRLTGKRISNICVFKNNSINVYLGMT